MPGRTLPLKELDLITAERLLRRAPSSKGRNPRQAEASRGRRSRAGARSPASASSRRSTHLLQPGGDGPRLALGLGLEDAAAGDAEHAAGLGGPAAALAHGGGGGARAGDVTGGCDAGSRQWPIAPRGAARGRALPRVGAVEPHRGAGLSEWRCPCPFPVRSRRQPRPQPCLPLPRLRSQLLQAREGRELLGALPQPKR